MFETAVVGALPGSALGVVRQCIACRAAAGPDARPCPGFGQGCFLTSREVPAEGTLQPLARSAVL